MTDGAIHGELQIQIMGTLWRDGEGTVERVRAALPPQHRSAYTTVQTVLNRLAERGLLERRKEGNQIMYTPSVSEGEYLSRSIQRALAGSSSEAREVALVQLIGSIDRDEFSALQRRARRIHAARGSGDR